MPDMPDKADTGIFGKQNKSRAGLKKWDINAAI